jgi:MIT (microtubule interacting and transport) domain
MSADALLNAGFAHLQVAIDLDERKDLESALQPYAAAVNCFQQALQYEFDLSRREVLKSKIDEYSTRMFEIESELALLDEFDDDTAVNDGTSLPPWVPSASPESLASAAAAAAAAAAEAEKAAAAAQASAVQARSLLERALVLEESKSATQAACIQAYIAAAVAYRDTAAIVNEPCKRAALEKQAGEILDHVDELKAAIDLNALVANMPIAPPPTTPVLHKTATPPTVTKPPNSAPAAVNRKRNAQGIKTAGINNTVKAGDLTAAEIEVLKKSSIVNGKLYMPWLEGEEHTEGFDFEVPWTDPDGLLSLAPKQQQKLVGMKRPKEIAKMRGSTEPLAMIKTVTPYTITQVSLRVFANTCMNSKSTVSAVGHVVLCY